jgi:endopolyphosphatase
VCALNGTLQLLMLLTVLLLAVSSSALRIALPWSPSTDTKNVVESTPHSALRKSSETPSTVRHLKGKFLHITDIHPDPYYKVYASTDETSACHRSKGSAGYYGAETSDCDSPLALIDATFAWLKTHMRDQVDFVVWTGDSARHDNDEMIPRSEAEVVGQNRYVVSQFLEAFGKPENWDDDDPSNDFVVPIVPTLGNNDILPHNIFLEGPNRWTTNYLDIWKQLIPEHQRHQFQRGGWFSVEVIPGKLMAFSLNTLYFFASNSAVDGCASKKEPGYEQFEWLRIQLELLRARGMKAILVGHVPPARVDAKVSWVESCWQKYALWMRMYRDVIVSGIYGHMNIDHFMLQDWEDVKKHVRKGKEYDSDDEVMIADDDDEFTIQSATDYLVSLRDKFATIPPVATDESYQVQRKKGGKKPKKPNFDDIGGEFGERYSVTIVGPSVVPNYFPTIRVFSYNISGLEDLELPAASSFHQLSQNHIQIPMRDEEDELSESHAARNLELRSLHLDESEELSDEQPDVVNSEHKKHKKDKKKKKPKKAHKFPLPKGPSKTTPPGPGYSPQTLSLLSFTQYYANLTHINDDYVNNNTISTEKWKPGKHHGKTPPKKIHPTPQNFTFEVEYDTAIDSIYGLGDLTVRSWLDLASKIAKSKKGGKSSLLEGGDDTTQRPVLSDQAHGKKKRNKTWFTFVKRAFVGTIDEVNVEDQFAGL